MGATAALSNSFLSAEMLLGGDKTLPLRPGSSLDWVAAIRKGLSAAAIDFLLDAMQISQAELAASLGIPARTLARRKREGVLSCEESAKLVRLARVVERAEVVFEDMSLALNWLKAPNAALDWHPPLSLLDTDIGAEVVMDTLGRIEHGVFV